MIINFKIKAAISDVELEVKNQWTNVQCAYFQDTIKLQFLTVSYTFMQTKAHILNTEVHEAYQQGHSHMDLSFPLIEVNFSRETASPNFGWNSTGVAPGAGYDSIIQSYVFSMCFLLFKKSFFVSIHLL